MRVITWSGSMVLLSVGLMLAACTVTGVASPAGAAAHSGNSTQFMGEPGYNAP